MALSRMTDEIGRVLGDRYRLVAPIGMGASGQVFLADDVRLRRRVAVKLLNPALGDDREFLRRFRAEVQAAAALRHPHIVVTHDWGADEGGSAYVVSEYLSGGSLRALLDRGNRLTPSQALQVGLAASRALDYAHRRGMVHRALKPANVLFGDDGRLRVADFGLARALAEAAFTEPQGNVLGAARYAAPEQARGQSIDGRADVYALALVLVEAVTGEVPFSADTVIGTLMARVDHDLEVPGALGPLRDALARAGRTDPGARLDAGGLATALMAVAEKLPSPGPLPLAGTLPDAVDLADEERDPTMVVLPAPAPLAPVEPLPAAHHDATVTPDPALLVAPDPVPVIEAPVPPASSATLYDRAVEDDSGPLAARVAAVPLATAAEVVPPPAPPATPPATPPAVVAGPTEPRRRRGRAMWVGAAVVVLLAALAAGLAGYRASRTPTHLVPTLARTDRAATAQLTALGFEVRREHTRRDGTVAGQVLGSRPAVGVRLAEGKTVTLVVSDGQTLVKVPAHLAGKPEADAVAFLKRQGLAVAPSQHEWSETVAADAVISYVGSPASRLPKGTTVTLLVSKGPQPRVLPDVSGLTPEQAAQKLTDLGLVPVTTKAYSDTVPSGDLVGLDPATGTSVARGATVHVVVSKGRELVAVPSMDGIRSIDDAIAALKAVGLTPGEAHGGLSGRPKRFDPPSGTMVPKGTVVDIILKLF